MKKTMKYTIIAVLGAGAVGGMLIWNEHGNQSVTFEREVATSTVEVVPDWADDEEAVEAAKAVIRRKELEAEEARLVDEISARQDELDEIRKELGTY
jgi:multidrug resistance efflux pump